MSGETKGVIWDPARLSAPHAQSDKAVRVRRMFDAIAPTYERVNAVVSAGRDRYWRRMMVRLAQVCGDDILLDLACGTGDVARTFAGNAPRPARILGVDFSYPMLREAQRRPIADSEFLTGDALRLPLASESVTLVTCAFGIRNFQHLSTGLGEMHRVLKPGGRAIVLEFTVPRNALFRSVYLLYARRVMPRLATWLSRDRTGAYRYLPQSVVSFQDTGTIRACFEGVGFSEVSVRPLTLGIVAVYVAWKKT